MIIYNETIIIEEAIHIEWLAWMKLVHIPNVLGTGCFQSYKILTVLDSPNEGVTYCFQYHADALSDVNLFYSEYMQDLHATHNQLFENKFVMFNTLMQTVE